MSPYEHALLAHLAEHWLSEARWARFKKVLGQRTRHITVVLDNLYQLHNASAVMRSCEAMGVQDLHMILRAKGLRGESGIAMGAEDWLTSHSYEGANATADCVQSLRQRGYRLVATTPHTNDYRLDELPLEQPVALLFGQEKPGLSDELLASADAHMRIPMQGFAESLNVSVSVALCLHECLNRLRASDIDWRLGDEQSAELALSWARQSIQHVAEVEARFAADRAAKPLAGS
jgi:tRNA (guanosine-2'-O-)-methyltransferase